MTINQRTLVISMDPGDDEGYLDPSHYIQHVAFKPLTL